MLKDFLSGAISMGFLVGALFFLRFWRRSGDGLFLVFAIAFAVLGLAQALMTLAGLSREDQPWIFMLRLAAFLLIAVGIAAKNRTRR